MPISKPQIQSHTKTLRQLNYGYGKAEFYDGILVVMSDRIRRPTVKGEVCGIIIVLTPLRSQTQKLFARSMPICSRDRWFQKIESHNHQNESDSRPRDPNPPARFRCSADLSFSRPHTIYLAYCSWPHRIFYVTAGMERCIITGSINVNWRNTSQSDNCPSRTMLATGTPLTRIKSPPPPTIALIMASISPQVA